MEMAQGPFALDNELFTLESDNGPSSPESSAGSSQSPRSTSRPEKLKLVLPSFYQGEGRTMQKISQDGQNEFREYFKQDLDVSRLNIIHKHLWFAGLPLNARALHHQVMIERQIIITEKADLHLLWRDNMLFLKPLPDYLLSRKIWKETLCTDRVLYEDANGFLLSYMWLIRHRSDLTIAHRTGLLCREMTWGRWTAFSRDVLSNLHLDTFSGISPRYLYGELRMGRIDFIYRLCHKTNNFTILVRGYQYSYHQYTTFVERNFAWVLTAIIYATIVLTAMQVGLATTQLKDNHAFNRASYGFTIFCILAPLIIIFIAIVTVAFLVVFNWIHTLCKRKKARDKYTAIFNNETLQQYCH